MLETKKSYAFVLAIIGALLISGCIIPPTVSTTTSTTSATTSTTTIATTSTSITTTTLPPQTGSIFASSSPGGASVAIDGVIRGVTPVTITNVSVGTRQVTYYKSGYYTNMTYVNVTAGQTTNVFMYITQNQTG